MIVFNHLPVTPLRVTSHFGKRNTGIPGASTFHKGVDMGKNLSKPETTVEAVAEGRIEDNYWNDTRGWVVIINHGEFKTLYQHLKEKSPLVKGGKIVAGQTIGIMGASTKTIKGMSVHLHFELIVSGESIDSLPYLENIQEVEDLTREETLKLIKEVLAGTGDEPSQWAKSSWEEAKTKGITDGTKPQGYCTREQALILIERAIKE